MKAKSITKRVLSAILCAVMLFSCWVFTAPSASAAAGTYDVKVYLDISNKMYCNGTQNITLYTTSNNGKGSQDGGSKQEFNTYNTGSVTKTWSGTGFPSKVTCYCGGSTWNNSGVKFGINVYVKKAGAADSAYVAVHTEGNSTRSHTAGFFSTVGSFTETLTSFTNLPYANSWDDISGNASINVNTDGSTTNTASYTAGAVYDQYGVRWYQDASLQAVSSFPVNGVTFSNGTISVPASSNRASNYTVKIKETFSNWTAKEKEITINTFDYKVTFKDENGTTVLKSEQTVDYNESATPPSDPTKASTATNHYTFNGWSGTYKNITSGAQSRDIKATYQATAHNSATYYKYTSVSATAHKKYCKDCGYVFAASEGHTANTAVEENRVEPTCTQAGSYDSVVYCKYCGYEMSRTETAIPALGHKWEKQTINADTLYQAATCDNAARYWYSCSRCDAIEKNNNHYFTDGDPLGHKWGKWVDDNNPTAGNIDSGTHTRTCDRDGTHTQTENHTFGNWQQIPSNDTSGVHESHDRATYHFHECNPNGCGRIVYAEHNWVAKTPVPATCTEAGYTEYECSDCHQTTVNLNPGDSVPALGHDFQYDPTGTPTDTQHREACSRCDATRMVDHPGYGDWYSVDGTYHAHNCTVCDKQVKFTHEGNWSGWQHEIPAATDTNAVRQAVRTTLTNAEYDHDAQCFNYCSVCARVEYQKHTETSEVTNPATCTEKGITTYTCSACGNARTDTNIPAKGHIFELTAAQPQDNLQGYACYHCTREKSDGGCGKYWVANYVYNKEEKQWQYQVPGKTDKAGVEEITDIKKSDPIPQPFFNDYQDGELDNYPYSSRGCSLKLMKDAYVDTNTRQDFRFSGSVQIPAGVSYKVNNPDVTDNVITDFGFVYTQDSYGGEYGAAKLTLANVAKDNHYAKMSVVDNNAGSAFDGSNWSGVTYHKNGNIETLTFNLVISIKAKNWKKQYAARPYIIYKYHGQVFTVYDTGASDVTGDYKYSYGSVYAIAADTIMYGGAPVVENYVINRFINHRGDFGEDDAQGIDWWRYYFATTWAEFEQSEYGTDYKNALAPYETAT